MVILTLSVSDQVCGTVENPSRAIDMKLENGQRATCDFQVLRIVAKLDSDGIVHGSQ